MTPPVTEDEAEALLRRDIGLVERAVLRLIAVPLADGQFDALVSFTFNLGAGALQRSTLRRKVNREEHTEVPAEFERWIWGGGHKLNGLVLRRKMEGRRYASSVT
jgi:GH24 family phage-related lysozyme (muramidase)